MGGLCDTPADEPIFKPDDDPGRAPRMQSFAVYDNSPRQIFWLWRSYAGVIATILLAMPLFLLVAAVGWIFVEPWLLQGMLIGYLIFLGLLLTFVIDYQLRLRRRDWAMRTGASFVRRRLEQLGDDEPKKRLAHQLELARHLVLSFRPVRDRDWFALRDRTCPNDDVPVPRTYILASNEAAKRLAAIELEDELLEPEIIEESPPTSLRDLVLMVLAMVLLEASGSFNTWLIIGLAVAFVLIFLAARWRLGRRFPFLRYSPPTWIAGPGFVVQAGSGKDGGEAAETWLAGEALVLVQVHGNRGPVYVRALGARGRRRRTLAFESLKDPDFLVLWQRWNHPHPRPDLMEATLAQSG